MRAVCRTACSCYLHWVRDVAANCDVADSPGKWVKRGCLVLGVGCRGTRSLLTRPYGESSRNRPYRGQAFGGATSEEQGEKKHGVCEHGLPTVPGVRNLEKENELWVAEEGETLKTEELEITRSNKSTEGPNELGVQGNKTRGYLVSRSTWANTPVTRG